MWAYHGESQRSWPREPPNDLSGSRARIVAREGAPHEPRLLERLLETLRDSMISIDCQIILRSANSMSRLTSGRSRDEVCYSYT